MFPEYLSLEDLEAGLLDGTLYSGKLRINMKNPNEAFVSVVGFKRDIAILDVKTETAPSMEIRLLFASCPRHFCT